MADPIEVRARRGLRLVAVVVAMVAGVVSYAVWDGDRHRASLREELRTLRARLAGKRELIGRQRDELAQVASAVDHVARTATGLYDRAAEVRRLANMEQTGGPMSSVVPATARDHGMPLLSEEAVRALEHLGILDDEMANAADSMAVLTALLRERPDGAMAVPSLWPVHGLVTSPYGTRRSPWGAGTDWHPGIDIKAQYGTPVTAGADGEVIFAGRDPGYGRLVVLAHGGDIDTFYGHLSALYVHEGQRVKKGEPIGAVGASGLATGAHLHFEVRVRNRPVDPTRYLN